MESKEKIYFFENSEIGKEYNTSTYYRCVGISKFIERVEKENKIVAFIVSGNKIGFVLDKKDGK